MDITVTNLQSKIPIPVSKIQSVAKKVAAELIQIPINVSVVFVGPQRMRSINRKYLGHDYVTDVITFDLEQSAEIVICPQVAFQNAKRYKNAISKEILLYVVHGFLHLGGFDDHSPQDIQKMRAQEQRWMDRLI